MSATFGAPRFGAPRRRPERGVATTEAGVDAVARLTLRRAANTTTDPDNFDPDSDDDVEETG